MRTLFLYGALVTGLACLSMPAYAIYRCEASGNVTYSDMPCPGATQLDIKDFILNSSSSDKKPRVEDQKIVKKAENVRRKEAEAQSKAQQRAAKKRAALDKKCVALSRRQRYASDDVSAAPQKSVERARRKANRIMEQYEAECANRRMDLLAS